MQNSFGGSWREPRLDPIIRKQAWLRIWEQFCFFFFFPLLLARNASNTCECVFLAMEKILVMCIICSFSSELLQGWAEGSGLGKDNQGMKSHIRVKNRTDNSGQVPLIHHDYFNGFAQ